MKKISALLLTLFLALSLCACSSENQNGESGLKHVVNYESGALSDFSPDEQKQILTAFNVVIPDAETDAYIHAFVREYDIKNDVTEGVYFWLEIGGVKDYDAFFKANEGRVKKTVIEPESDPYAEGIDLGEIEFGEGESVESEAEESESEESEASSVEPVILYENRSLNEEQSFVEGMTTGGYYLTYGLYCPVDEETAYPETFAFMKKLDEVYSALEKTHTVEQSKGSENG